MKLYTFSFPSIEEGQTLDNLQVLAKTRGKANKLAVSRLKTIMGDKVLLCQPEKLAKMADVDERALKPGVVQLKYEQPWRFIG